MIDNEWNLIASSDSLAELQQLKKDMLNSGRFVKYKVKAMTITKNEIK